MITFILTWCALSLVGTLFAVSLIRMGKKRQPEADGTPAPEAVTAAIPQKN